MSLGRRVLGQSGEDIAVLFFKQKEYEVVERNWRCKSGEIDLIIRKQDEWRFVEVKTRSSDRYGLPEEALTALKREHFYNSIEWYILQNQAKIQDVHADVLAVIINNHDFDVRWLPDALLTD